MNRKILVVEDEEKLAQLEMDYLQHAGYAHHHIADGADVISWVQENPVDAILLDLMLPNVDGITLCREIRQFSHVPIIMITAKVEEIDRLLGLEMGADDYICKPFSPREMIARLKALFRRIEQQKLPPETPCLLEVDETRMEVRIRGILIEQLTPVEFRLIHTLSKSPGQVFTRDKLLEHIYEDHRVVSDRTVDSHIKNLRRKLHDSDTEHEWIRSVYGVGYAFECAAD